MGKVFDIAIELASDQYGLFSIEQVREAGINPANIYQLAARGSLEKRSRGVFMVSSFPFHELTDHMEAVLSVKGGSHIADESALELWDLCDVNPLQICLAVPKKYRPRKRDLDKYRLVNVNLENRDVDTVSNIPVMAPQLALERAIDNYLRGDLAEQAIDKGVDQGYLTKQKAARLRVQLDDREQAGK